MSSIERRPNGRWAPGTSGNPSGRRKRPQTIRGALRERLRADAADDMTGIDKLVDRMLTLAATFDDLLNLAKFLEGPHPAQNAQDGDPAYEDIQTLRDILDDLRSRRDPRGGEVNEETVDAIEDALREGVRNQVSTRDMAEHLAKFVGARPAIIIPGLSDRSSFPKPIEDEDQ